MTRQQEPASGSRVQRALATMAVAVIGLSALAIVVLLICQASGVPASAFSSGILQLVGLLPLPGLTIGLLLIIAVIVVSATNRARAGRG
ncbi:MAG: hypothetical protein QOE37_1686 [Microbacteriaceae bacterium]|nr:hypothetical protein [Microbacteriaceae bacterium]